MSAFLGPIHFWLYKKICLVMEREALLLQFARSDIGDLADELYSQVEDLYGKPISVEADLEDIIDHEHIHDWLQRQIELVEVREAIFIKDLIDIVPDEADPLISQAFYEHGKKCANEAKLKLSDIEAPVIYKIMQDYYLNGMPCDGGDIIIEAEENSFVWQGTHDHQLSNWKKAGVLTSVMSRAYQSWFSGFVETISPLFTFSVNKEMTPVRYCIDKK